MCPALLTLCGTCLWIANNLIAGAVGGAALEVLACVNPATIARMAWLRAA
ncbi:YgjV family protein [Duganella callida]|uniref:Uncharacterized protein n=1 Tax=Duganella callida TaxID=2561932 RepID=A0A4Y9SL98_9BURK|nr:YgjV family protein [Duganella callida]TFW24330.1 hypothetical protein E4L98_10255 [Duganella callida]